MEEGSNSSIRNILYRLLVPVVRVCIRCGLTNQQLQRVIREVFVDCAREELISSRGKATVSQLSLLTGLSRKEVNKIEGSDSSRKEKRDLRAIILSHWTRYHKDKRGNPTALTFGSARGQFEKLVNRISTDYNPGSVRRELERIGAITREGDKLVIKTDTLYQGSDYEESLTLLASDIEDYYETFQHNTTNFDEPPHLHLRTFFDNIFLTSMPEVNEWIITEGEKYHAKLREFLGKHDKDLNPSKRKVGGGRIAVTSFARVVTPPQESSKKAVND